MQNTHPIDNPNSMTVDIRLCGNIPRDEMKSRFGAPTSQTALTSHEKNVNGSCLAGINGSPTLGKAIANGLIVDTMKPRGVLTEKQQILAPVLEPPKWAVPARGETRLEPVCESLGRQSAVDLTLKKSFRVGRSPNCDIQLMHATSSRRHAMLFHHANGSCYLVDCGSAHGTFINGKRVSSPAVTGVVVPHKVRRGSLIRFGGPGAPCFVLKSFNFTLRDLDADEALVRRNTRVNALGKTACERVCSIVDRKRSFDSLSSKDTIDCCDYDELPSKRLRCSSPPMSPELPLRLVSPDLTSSPKRVVFSMDPPQLFYPTTITPEESGDEDGTI